MKRIGANKNPGNRAFTLVEILVATALITVLGGLISAGIGAVMANAQKTKEVQAGRSLILAYRAAAVDRDGVFLPGYDRTTSEVQLENGTSVHGPTANRYPFRLGAFFDYQMDGTVLVGKNKTQIKTSDTYSVSCYPAFGINYLFVGGDVSSSGGITIPEEVVTRAAQGANPLVFATSGSVSSSGEPIHGFSILTPPQIYGPMWKTAPWKQGEDPGMYGNVHARHKDKAICVFLDGSIRSLGIEEMRDMRLWSMRAASEDKPNYTVTAAAPPPSSGRRR